MKLLPVPLAYLKEGDRFVATRPSKFTQNELRSGVASMDGHMVSEVYGFRVANHYYSDRDKNYINVYFDGVVYGEPNKWNHPNSTLYERDSWTVYVTADIEKRVTQDIITNQNWTKNREARDLRLKKIKLLEQVAILQKQIEELD